MNFKEIGASTVAATITARDGGGFVAVASTGDMDRDNEVIQPGCFDPLPASIPVHLDHTMSASTVVARGRPYYESGRLMIDANFASTDDAQVIRQKVADGVIDSMSIVFHGSTWETINGIRTCVQGELLAADIVSIPSQRNSRILSLRGYQGDDWADMRSEAKRTCTEALVALAMADLEETKRYLASLEHPSARSLVDRQLRELARDTDERNP